MSMQKLEELGRVRLSRNFFMREMLYSETANFHGMPNIPDDPKLAIAAGRRLCEELLEPLHAHFGRVVIRSAFRSVTVNEFGTRPGYSCGPTEWNYARHIWDRRDAEGRMGATACVVIPWFIDRQKEAEEAGLVPLGWEALAWWIHDHLPYSDLCFYPVDAAFNIRWSERPNRRIESYKIVNPEGEASLTEPGMENHVGDHRSLYPGLPTFRSDWAKTSRKRVRADRGDEEDD